MANCTKKNYNIAVEVIQTYGATEAERIFLTDALIEFFKRDGNPNFDAKRFKSAANGGDDA